MAVGWRAVTLSGVEEGQRALVAGAGPIGFGILFALQARGVDDVIVSEPSESRWVAAERLGVQTVDPTARDLAEVIGERGVTLPSTLQELPPWVTRRLTSQRLRKASAASMATDSAWASWPSMSGRR